MTKETCKIYLIYVLVLTFMRFLNFENMVTCALSLIIALLVTKKE